MLKAWLNSTLIMHPGPMLRNTQSHTQTQGGRADICYMSAMINRLIRNGLITFTVHIKNCMHTWQRSLLARTWLAACVAGSAPINRGLILFARQWSQPFPYLIVEQQSGWLRLDCLSSSQKSWDGERCSFLRKWHPIPPRQSNWLLVGPPLSGALLSGKCDANPMLCKAKRLA